jgi:hypothetical protein
MCIYFIINSVAFSVFRPLIMRTLAGAVNFSVQHFVACNTHLVIYYLKMYVDNTKTRGT